MGVLDFYGNGPGDDGEVYDARAMTKGGGKNKQSPRVEAP